jgi:ATP-dependent Clp protease ATP-binding subunit ClpA
MFWNFTDEYKKILISAENLVKNNWYSQILTEDVFLEIIKNQVGTIYEVFMDYWINEKVVLDVLSQKEFSLWFENRKWKFIWISESLKNTIVWSFKIAASFNKNKAWVEDFILSLIMDNVTWFINFLNFVWINPKDLEQSISNINKNLQTNKYWWLFEPINNILNILEQWFLAWQDFEDMQNNPFFANKKPWNQKEETQTPALDFFGIDLTEEAKNW